MKEGEIALQKKRKDNTNDIIGRHLIEPKEKSRFKIPLCRFISLPLVRPINEVDVQRLENEFEMVGVGSFMEHLMAKKVPHPIFSKVEDFIRKVWVLYLSNSL